MFSAKIREAAVEMVVVQGRKQKDVAGALGVSYSSVNRWVRNHQAQEQDKAFLPGQITNSYEQRELVGKPVFIEGEQEDPMSLENYFLIAAFVVLLGFTVAALT